MRYRLSLACRTLFICLCLLAAGVCWRVEPSGAQTDSAAEMLARINAARAAQGLAPFALNEKLAAAAQAHSQDMAQAGKVDRTGTDGSTPKSRILAAGYGQWTSGPIVDEAIYGGTDGAQGAFEWWLSAAADKNRLFSQRYREAGVGVAKAANGWLYWTLDLGAQPNVLPFFVNGGATTVSTLNVTLTLTTENAVSAGEGADTVGQPIQVRAASDDSFAGTDWQPWAQNIPFQLQRKAQQVVYVLYRDEQGRTASASVNLTLTNVPTALPATLTRISSPTAPPTAVPPSKTPLPPKAQPQTTPTSQPRASAPTLAASATAVALVSTPRTPGQTPGVALVITPRAALRQRVTPTATVVGPYGTPPAELPLILGGLQGAAFVLVALLILRRSLNRMPPAPNPTSGDETGR